MVEWKNQDHCTAEASHARLNRVSCKNNNTGSPHEGTVERNRTGIIGQGAVPAEGVRLAPEHRSAFFTFGVAGRIPHLPALRHTPLIVLPAARAL